METDIKTQMSIGFETVTRHHAKQEGVCHGGYLVDGFFGKQTLKNQIKITTHIKMEAEIKTKMSAGSKT